MTILARSYDQDQWAHAFGIANLPPAIDGSTGGSLIDWYWGPTQGSVAATVQSNIAWLANAIQYAGPQLTPKNVERGIFTVPGRGGAAWHDPASTQSGFGRTAGLPNPGYLSMGVDYAPIWYDAATVGPSNGLTAIGKGVNWYLDGAKRYIAGTWPTKPFPFFQKNGAVVEVTPIPRSSARPCPVPAVPAPVVPARQAHA